MSGERTVPLPACRSVDEIAGFCTMLGFTRTYRRERPNPYVVMERDDLHPHFFGLPGFRPEGSYGSCLVVVPDIVELFDAFAARMRAAHGKLPVSGIPRMTRPRRRKNAEGVTGFAVIDPGGNWIRFTAGRAYGGAAQRRGHGRLARRPRAGRASAGGRRPGRTGVPRPGRTGPSRGGRATGVGRPPGRPSRPRGPLLRPARAGQAG
ncbi:hypothetical protein ACIQY8_12370 [Streptomyces albidoflavus]